MLGPVTLNELPVPFLTLIAVALGLLFGSFLNVVIHRLPRGQSVAFPPSTCPSCGARIAPYDNFPVLSWLLLRGKARCCGAPISVRYPAVELVGGLLGWAVLVLRVQSLPGDTLVWVAALEFGLCFTLGLLLLAALFIDVEFMILPDRLTLGGTLLGFASLPFRDISVWDSILGAAVGFFVVYLPFYHGYRLLRGQPGMGLGDAKLLALAGAWFGWQGALFALCAGAVQGTFAAIAMLVARGRIDEPEAVQNERAELESELEQMTDEERKAVEKELEGDILLHPPENGFMDARLAFGPFLALSIVEYMLAREWILETFRSLVWQA
jgi:leader peptidase (prepilin peptidase) / N-methyltransferase